MNSRKSFHREVKMMIAEGFTCQRYGFNVGADKFSLLTIENGKTSIMRLSEWTLISQSQKSHSDRLLAKFFPDFKFIIFILKINFHHIYGNLVVVISLVIIGNNLQYFPFIFRGNIRPKINRNRITCK